MRLFAPLLIFAAFTDPGIAGPAVFGNAHAITGGPTQRSGASDAVPLATGSMGERYSLAAEYDRTPDSVWYGFVEGNLERDRLGHGTVRGILATGSGYRLYHNANTRLSLRGGLSYSGSELNKDNDDRYAGLGYDW